MYQKNFQSQFWQRVIQLEKNLTQKYFNPIKYGLKTQNLNSVKPLKKEFEYKNITQLKQAALDEKNKLIYKLSIAQCSSLFESNLLINSEPE